jgi:hypothetical protein
MTAPPLALPSFDDYVHPNNSGMQKRLFDPWIAGQKKRKTSLPLRYRGDRMLLQDESITDEVKNITEVYI